MTDSPLLISPGSRQQVSAVNVLTAPFVPAGEKTLDKPGSSVKTAENAPRCLVPHKR